tara:strand:- start:6363 stop:7004 length:642 start_codon:yes stop_codon:yes gene_type:complete
MKEVYHLRKEPKLVFLNKKAKRFFIKNKRNQRRMQIITGSILSIFAVLAVTNEHLMNKNQQIIAMQEMQQNQSRGIASIGSIGNQSYQKAFQEKVAMELKNSLKKEEAILGKKPSKEDEFLKGFLAGNYAIEKDGSKHLKLKHNGGEKTKISSMNSLLFHLVEAFYQGDFNEIKKVSSAETQTEFIIRAPSGEEATIKIDHDVDKRIESIEMN